MDRLTNAIKHDYKLTFSERPQTLADPTPEPREAQFIGVRNWLWENWRYVQNELAPLGHHAMDQRRLSLIRQLREHITRLDKMQARAWSKCITEHLIRTQWGTDSDQGPLKFALGS